MKKLGIITGLWLLLAISGIAWGQSQEDQEVKSLHKQIVNLHKEGRYPEALPLAQRALQISEQIWGAEHAATAQSLTDLASLHKAMGKYEQALPLFQRSLNISEKALGPEHSNTATNLNNLAELYRTMGKYDQALPLYQRALTIKEKVVGPEHLSIATILNNLALLYKETGKYEQALPLFQRSLMLKEKNLGTENPAIATSLNNLAELFRTMGSYNQALPLSQRALQINEKVLGSEHPTTALSLNNLALLYRTMGSYDQALPLCQRSLQISEKALGPEHPSTAQSLNNLAELYRTMGSYNQALPLYQRSLLIREKVLGPEHPITAQSLNNLAFLYRSLGLYDQALPLYKRSLQISEKVLGPEHPNTANGLNNLALLYQAMGNYDQALQLIQQALNIREKALGPSHPITNATINNLGYIFLDQRDYEKAENYFRRSQSSSGLVELALVRDRFGEALPYLPKLKPSWKATPKSQIQYSTLLGLTQAGLGKRGEAAGDLLQAVQMVEELRQKVSVERAGYFQGGIYGGNVRPYRGLVMTLAEMHRKQESLPVSLQKYGPGADEAAFYFAEATKARALLEDLAAVARRQPGAGISAELRRREQELHNQWEALDKQWEQALSGGEAAIQEVQERREKLRGAREELMQELRRDYPRYAALHYPLPLPARELPLQENEVLLAYALGDKGGYVFVLRKGGIKKLYPIPLAREALESRVKEFMEPMQAVELNKFSPGQAHELYNLLLAPALPEVKENDRIIIVPEGILGLLPFEALVSQPGPEEKDRVYVGDKFTLTYYQSATVMAWQRQLKTEKVNKTLFALGNPVYNPADPRYKAVSSQNPPSRPGGQHPEPAAFRGLATRQEGGAAGKDEARGSTIDFSPLPETAEEVKAIAGMWGVKSAPPDILLDLKANETTLLQSPLRDYRYLHFATHADLAGKIQGINEPFILLGQVENSITDNGFLTLSKVLGLELHADLVVLSACMTGRGQVMAGEGVANFPRAFQYAGAKSVLVSLWPLASHEAVEYMTTFYSHLKSGKNRAEALALARRAIKAKYLHPFYWAVFILNGEGY